MADKELLARVLPGSWASSFVGRARVGDLHDADQERRAQAWARWALDNLSEFKGLESREYLGLVLPGKFHDPRGNGPAVSPHIEVPARLLNRQDPTFPDRLAQLGNGLLFPWWVFSEVTAVRRALFTSGDPVQAEFIELLSSHQAVLATAVESMSRTASTAWPTIEAELLGDPEKLAPLVTDAFDESAVKSYLPKAASFGVQITFDAKLLESQGVWAARRVGVWSIKGQLADKKFRLGTITPRLTFNSMFRDVLFTPSKESSASLLVRGLLLSRLLAHLGLENTNQGVRTPIEPTPRHIRAVVARPGAKLPQASVKAAVHFIQSYADADAAWAALQLWAGEEYLLTVSRDAFSAAHGRAARNVRRAEEPDREDIDTILPICWDDRSRVVRATFSLPDEPA